MIALYFINYLKLYAHRIQLNIKYLQKRPLAISRNTTKKVNKVPNKTSSRN